MAGGGYEKSVSHFRKKKSLVITIMIMVITVIMIMIMIIIIIITIITVRNGEDSRMTKLVYRLVPGRSSSVKNSILYCSRLISYGCQLFSFLELSRIEHLPLPTEMSTQLLALRRAGGRRLTEA